ncbi:MAG TPA: ABC transporter substrate-binding protein [Membranihabitans sp.]|nr:ABC transporter substrate-binding protein [Membranihabitans sp.]
MKSIIHGWGLFSGLVLLLFWSCGQEAIPERSNLLRIQVSGEVDILNPALSRLSVSTFIEKQMLLPLAKWDNQTKTWIPVLIQSYQPRITRDGVDYPLTTRLQARWSDGHPVTLNDIVYTIKMGLNPYISHQSWAAYLSLISDIRTTGDTLVLTMETPYILADEFIAGLTPYPAHRMDSTSILDSIPFSSFLSGRFTEEEDQRLQKLAQAFNSHGSPEQWPKPVSGLFQVSNWIPGQQITLDRVDNFWGENQADVKTLFDTNIDSVQFVIIPDPQNALHAFTSGAIDILSVIDDRDSALLASFSGEVHDVPTLQMFYLAVNNTHPLLGNKIIRQALNKAINREDIINRLFHGRGKSAFGPIHPDKSYYTAFPVEFDPVEARRELEAIGCQDIDGDGILECPVKDKLMELTLGIWTTRSQLSRNVATLIKGYWKSIGVNLEIQSADFRSFLPELQNKSYDLAALALRQNNLLDDPFPLWHSSQSDAAGKNYQGLSNDSIDLVLEHLRESVIPEDQAYYYNELQNLFAEQVPVFFLVAPDEAIAVRDGIDLYWSSQRPGYDLLRSKINR